MENENGRKTVNESLSGQYVKGAKGNFSSVYPKEENGKSETEIFPTDGF